MGRRHGARPYPAAGMGHDDAHRAEHVRLATDEARAADRLERPASPARPGPEGGYDLTTIGALVAETLAGVQEGMTRA